MDASACHAEYVRLHSPAKTVHAEFGYHTARTHAYSLALTIGLGGKRGRGQELNGTPHLAGPDMPIADQQ